MAQRPKNSDQPARLKDDPQETSSPAKSDRGRSETRPSRQPRLLKETRPPMKPETRQGVTVTILIAIALISVLSLIQLAGGFGKGLDGALRWLFGWARFAFPIVLVVWASFLYRPQKFTLRPANYVGLFVGWFGFAGLLQLFVPVGEMSNRLGDGSGGGAFGVLVAWPLMSGMGYVASTVVLLAMFIIGLLVMFDTSLNTLAERGNILKRFRLRWLGMTDKFRANRPVEEVEPPPLESDDSGEDNVPEAFQTRDVISAADGVPLTEPKSIPTPKPRVRRKISYDLGLLDATASKPTSGDIVANQERIRKTLENFGIDVEMGDVNVG